MNALKSMHIASDTRPMSQGTNTPTIVETFLRWMDGRSFSPNTIRRRRTSLTQFAEEIAPLPLAEATHVDIEEWLATKTTARTRHAYRSDLSVFYKWALRRGYTEHDPTELTDPIILPKALPRPLPVAQVMHAFYSARTGTLQLMIALAAFAGLRCAEIAGLDASDIATHGRVPLLTVRGGKGAKDRTVPLHPLLVAALGKLPSHGALFPGKSPDAIGDCISRHLHALGYDANAHQLRHSFGTQAAEAARGNLVLVASLMGHASIQTTMGYNGWAGGPAAEVVAMMYGGAA